MAHQFFQSPDNRTVHDLSPRNAASKYPTKPTSCHSGCYKIFGYSWTLLNLSTCSRALKLSRASLLLSRIHCQSERRPRGSLQIHPSRNAYWSNPWSRAYLSKATLTIQRRSRTSWRRPSLRIHCRLVDHRKRVRGSNLRGLFMSLLYIQLIDYILYRI